MITIRIFFFVIIGKRHHFLIDEIEYNREAYLWNSYKKHLHCDRTVDELGGER